MDKENEEWKPKSAEEKAKELTLKYAEKMFTEDFSLAIFEVSVRANFKLLWDYTRDLENKIKELEKEINSLKVG